MNLSIESTTGKPMPLGTSAMADGTNFAIFSRHATRVWLMLFDKPDDDTPCQEFELDPIANHTGDIWHIHLSGVKHGHFYLYRMDGPYQPSEGHRFNRHKSLLDPYAKATVGGAEFDLSQTLGYDPFSPETDLSFSIYANIEGMPKCIVYTDDGFDWQGDRPINRSLHETIIYETHVRNLTWRHPHVEHPGTYLGVAEMIPYFKQLGVTAIELLPTHLFNEIELIRNNPYSGERLRNHWGYNTLAFFAPHESYSHRPEPGGVVLSFKEMVKALHKAGLEIIMDVVFNHTIEGNQMGPTLSFRGIDNSIYYILSNDKRYYMNYSGVGNTFNANHPVVQEFIVDCLRYWVQELHVDGFRFDLATSLCRDQRGNIPAEPPLVIRIAEDPWLRSTKIIAEPWDTAAYQVGDFPGGRWAEWNDKYRDQVRFFWRGDPNTTSGLATRLAGSSDLYGRGHRRTPNYSINFLAAHDGFTLNDVVSYDNKHNEANGENNGDGHNQNISYNYGFEGATDNRVIEAIRSRQVKNLLTTLMLSQGTPMLNGGDEFRRTQQGNNNAYCQHNEISWYNWNFLNKYSDVFDFACQIIAMRKQHPVFHRMTFFTGMDRNGNSVNDIQWFAASGGSVDWTSFSRELICVLDGAKEEIDADKDDSDVVLMFNADLRSHLFYLPPPPHAEWRWFVAVDTGMHHPRDIFPTGKEIELEDMVAYHVQSRSVVVLISKPVSDDASKWLLRETPHKHLVPKPRICIKTTDIHKGWLKQNMTKCLKMMPIVRRWMEMKVLKIL